MNKEKNPFSLVQRAQYDGIISSDRKVKKSNVWKA